MSCTLSVSLHTVGVAHTVTFSVVQCHVHSWCRAHCRCHCTLSVLRTLSLSVLCSVVYTLGVVHTVGVMRAHCHCVHSDKFVAMLTLHLTANN